MEPVERIQIEHVVATLQQALNVHADLNYADKSNILIDDRADNIQQWKDAGGIGILLGFAIWVLTAIFAYLAWLKLRGNIRISYLVVILIIGVGYIFSRFLLDPSILRIEDYEPASSGYLGGAGLPVLLSWFVVILRDWQKKWQDLTLCHFSALRQGILENFVHLIEVRGTRSAVVRGAVTIPQSLYGSISTVFTTKKAPNKIINIIFSC